MGLLKKVMKGIIYPKKGLARICEKYLENFNGFSYEFSKNGEADVLRKLSAFEMKTIFDVGSNVGDWALIANEYLRPLKIHCFELSEKTFETLSKNIIGNQYVLNNVALSNVSGNITYKDYGINSGVNTILLDANFHNTPFELMKGISLTGNEYCITNNIKQIDFLKIDVEGAEHYVLEGFSECLREKRIRVIQFEYGYTNGDAKYLMKDFYELFDGYGYIVGRIRPGVVEFDKWTYKLNDFNSGPNYIAVLKTEEALIEILSKKKIGI